MLVYDLKWKNKHTNEQAKRKKLEIQLLTKGGNGWMVLENINTHKVYPPKSNFR